LSNFKTLVGFISSSAWFIQWNVMNHIEVKPLWDWIRRYTKKIQWRKF
jgi:hypothetical protein